MSFSLSTYFPHYKSLFKLGIPIVIGQIGNVVLGFADTLMIGHHSTQELAAAGFVLAMFVLLLIISLGFSLGLTPIVSSLNGSSEIKRIGEVFKNSLFTNTLLAIGLICIAVIIYLNIHRLGQPEELLPYMRSYLLMNILTIPALCWFNSFKQLFDGIGDTKVPMIIILFGNLLNIFLNWVLIYGHLGMAELGLLGAGIATLIARSLMFIALCLTFAFRKRYRLHRGGFIQGRINKKDFYRLCSLGIPVAIQLSLETSAFSLAAIFVGWIGTTALAAHQIMLTVSQVLYMISSGLASAVAVRVGYFYGKKDSTNIYRAAYSGFHSIVAVAIILSIPVFLLRWHFGAWFTTNEEASLLVGQVVIPLIAYQFGDALQYNFASSLRGIAYVKPMIWIAFFSYFIVSLPLSYVLGIHFHFGLVGIWAAFPVCLLMAGVLYFVYFKKRMKLNIATLCKVKNPPKKKKRKSNIY